MCYAKNSMGSVQRIIEISANDKNKIDSDQSKVNDKNDESAKYLNNEYKMMKKNLDKDRKALKKMKNKMENEIESIKKELVLKNRKGVGIEATFEQAILADLGNMKGINMYLNFFLF